MTNMKLKKKMMYLEVGRSTAVLGQELSESAQ
jgi:hypothetical protein